jgi:hypothetical protein
VNLGRTVFSQLVDFLPTYQFQICVDRYQGNRHGCLYHRLTRFTDAALNLIFMTGGAAEGA